jgi:hypothetical protein
MGSEHLLKNEAHEFIYGLVKRVWRQYRLSQCLTKSPVQVCNTRLYVRERSTFTGNLFQDLNGAPIAQRQTIVNACADGCETALNLKYSTLVKACFSTDEH